MRDLQQFSCLMYMECQGKTSVLDALCCLNDEERLKNAANARTTPTSCFSHQRVCMKNVFLLKHPCLKVQRDLMEWCTPLLRSFHMSLHTF